MPLQNQVAQLLVAQQARLEITHFAVDPRELLDDFEALIPLRADGRLRLGPHGVSLYLP